MSGRVLISILFLGSGIEKLLKPEATIGYMSGAGIPYAGAVFLLVVLLELGAGLALLIGYQVRVASVLLAIFTAIATLLFHMQLSDPNELAHFLKNVAVIGGLVHLASVGAIPNSAQSILSRFGA
jgi:putative oxidoreductase